MQVARAVPRSDTSAVDNSIEINLLFRALLCSEQGSVGVGQKAA